MTTIEDFAAVAVRSREYRRLVSPIVAQIAQQAEMQRRLMAPFADAMRTQLEMQKKYEEAVVEPIRRQAEMRKALLSSHIAEVARIEEARRKLITPIFTAMMVQQDYHKRLMAPFIQAIVQQEKLRNQLFSPVVEQMARHAQIQKAIIAQLTQQTEQHRKQLEPSSSFLAQLRSIQSIRIDRLDEAFKSLADESTDQIAYDDVTAVEAVINEPGFGNLPIVEQINRLIEAVRELKSSTAQKIAVTIATVLITLVLTDCYTKFKEHFFGPDRPTVIVREIRTIVRDSQIDPDTIREYRIVSHHFAVVQRSRRPKSQRIGVMEAGDIVQLVKKQGSWCLIVWRDDSARDVISGWTRSKYLKKMSK